jgi:pimeloyl-ACP methyl ester carboxylesterase
MPAFDDVLQVGGGRRVGYRLFGADVRPNLLYLHGAPGSRVEVSMLYELDVLEDLGVCAAAVDRPGYGATDPLADLDRLARATDAEAVAEHLGMEHFVVQGTSAGGQYALASAILMPDQVRAVILASAGGRIGEEDDLAGMDENLAEGWRQEWRDLEGARGRIEAEMAEMRIDPMRILRQWSSDWPADERDWLENNGKVISEDMREAARQGAVGYGLDGLATGRPWPFDVAEIRVPIHVFHGESDAMAPLPTLRRSLAGASGVTRECIYPGGSHASPWVTRDRRAAMLAIVTG